MISTITQNNTLKKILKSLAALIFWVAVWWLASILISHNLKIFLPSPLLVAKKWFFLIKEPEYWRATGATVLRILAGFISGAVLGILAGILTSSFSLFDIILSPMLRVIRAVPVVSFIILAFLFINTDMLPVFISSIMVIPLVWQSVHDSLTVSCSQLCEMGKVFSMSKTAILFKIKLPFAAPEILTAGVSGLGFAWKSGVAAEVLFSPAVSIGKSIYRAKFLLDFSGVYALTLTVVLLSLIIEFLLKKAVSKGGHGND